MVGDKRLTENLGILQPKVQYWDIPVTKEIKLHVLQTIEFQDEYQRELQKASYIDNEIQDIKRYWTKEGKR